MGTSVFFGQGRESELKLKPGDLSRIGVRRMGPVLAGELSVQDARQKALFEAQRRTGERETDWYLRLVRGEGNRD